jgi:hypothetical protein
MSAAEQCSTKHKYITSKCKVTQSHYRPGQTLRVPGGSQISRQSALEGGKGCQPHAPAAFISQEIFLVLISVRGWVEPRAIVWPEGLCQWKLPVTPWEIKLATFRLVAQCLNQLRHCVPHILQVLGQIQWVNLRFHEYDEEQVKQQVMSLNEPMNYKFLENDLAT